ncbi:Hypothetical protein GLP15_5007 [Giardia lamblia P15]|uniref:Uncharacterized protein n=1 Tax=Giardia intestinalis (strain P15) TaxID=658858 RepID=E1EVL9_GIAIA|nr:Hypothetical protein GLP15_5007 [Giardia lamblia P15]
MAALDEIREKRAQILKELCVRRDYTHALLATPAAVCRARRAVKDAQVLDSCTMVFRDIDRDVIQRAIQREPVRPSWRSNVVKLDPIAAIKK